jgi:hypothetical protein
VHLGLEVLELVGAAALGDALDCKRGRTGEHTSAHDVDLVAPSM